MSVLLNRPSGTVTEQHLLSLEKVNQLLIDEYQCYLAAEMLSGITCYSATETFSEITRELAETLGISPLVAAQAHLLPVAHTILEGAKKASSQFRIEAN